MFSWRNKKIKNNLLIETKVLFRAMVFNIQRAADLTLVLLNPDMPCLANSVDPDQASEEANWPGPPLFVI